MSVPLSAEQQQVVDHRGGHLQVIACAGSGKTESISRRIAALIDEGAEPASIVAFTFTERAAEELKERIVRRVREAKGAEFLDRLGPMFVGTIHSYCFKLLQDHVPELGNFDVLDPHRQAGLLSRERKRLGIDKLGPKHWQPIRDFLRNADIIENELIDPKLLEGTPIGDCYSDYCRALERYRYLTFGQIISLAVHHLRRPHVFARVHGPLRHLIVDEYQDINPAQEALIRLLALPPVHLCVVGDDDQAIYQWRGSEVANIVEFTNRYADAATRSLATNRRSCSTIVRAANAFAASIQPRLDKSMEPARPDGEPAVVCWRAQRDEEEAKTIADAIVGLHQRGFGYGDIAVLYRSVRTSAPPLIGALAERDVPVRCAGRTGLFLQPEVSALARTYAWFLDFDWREERWGESERVELPHLLADYATTFGAGHAIPGLERFLKDWKKVVPTNTRPVNLIGDLYRLLHFLGVHELDPDEPVHSARLGALARFSKALADFENVTRRGRPVEEQGRTIYRGGADRGKEYYQRLYNYLQHYARDAYEEFEGEDSVELDAVDVLTVHQAKGLEWRVVFVPALVDGRFPSRRAGSEQEWLLPEKAFPRAVRARYEGGETEERRLFYVAMTRARDVLYLSRFERKKNRFRPSPFLLEVAGGEPPIRTTLPLPAAPEAAGPEPGATLSVSFSDLASYEECPFRYRLSALLGFQPQIVIELGYGRAIHHVLRQVAELARATGTLPTPEQVRALLDASFYLPFANRPAHERLHAAAHRLVERYLGDWSNDLRRVWATERPFELHLEGGTVGGRADVILDEEGGRIGSLAIVDYKTATDERADDLFGFQLAVYAAAARGEGLRVDAAYLHQLKSGERQVVATDPPVVANARRRATRLLGDLRAALYPPNPEPKKCRRCDYRAVCNHAACSPMDLHET